MNGFTVTDIERHGITDDTKHLETLKIFTNRSRNFKNIQFERKEFIVQTQMKCSL